MAAVDAGIIEEVGGELLTIVNPSVTYPLDTPLEVFLGPNGNATDPQCYGGQGYGYLPEADNVTTLTIVTPPVGAGSPRYVSWREEGGGSIEVVAVLVVLERNWPSKGHVARKSYPPWVGIGARRLDLEGLSEGEEAAEAEHTYGTITYGTDTYGG